MAIVQRPDSRVYMSVSATEPTTLPTIAQITASANRVDNKGLDRMTLQEVRQRRVRLGNDTANTGKVYRDALKGQDFTASWRAEYRDDATGLMKALFNNGLCANYVVSFVFRREGDGSGKAQYYGHCLISTPTEGEDARGTIYTFASEGHGGLSVSNQ